MKVYGPSVVEALGEALRCLYWYKDDLRSFLTRAGLPRETTGLLDWTAPKRVLVRALLDRLSQQPDRGTALISNLIDAVVEQEDFLHLRRLEDGERKAEDARVAVERLKDLLGRESIAERAERARAQNRTEADRRRNELAERKTSLAAIDREFAILHSTSNEQRRGLDFEPFLRRLFALFDLDPRGAFTLPGEQTDGSIRLDSQLFLVEARWRMKPSDPDDIRSFRGKVEEKLDNTLGLYISMNGFTDEAIKRAAVPPAKVILLDGQDLILAIQGHVDLLEMLRKKIRRAAETGEVLARVR